jgi:hypothetical protein
MNNQYQLRAFVWLAIPLLFVLAGFTFQSPKLAQGTYTINVTDADFPAKFPAEERSALSGKWELTLAENGVTKIMKDGQLVAEGRYSSTADRFVITDEQGPLSCSQAPGLETGIYKWTIAEDKLTLKAIEDKCDGRRFILTLLPWKKQA